MSMRIRHVVDHVARSRRRDRKFGLSNYTEAWFKNYMHCSFPVILGARAKA